MSGVISPITRFVRELDGGTFYRLSEAAEMIGVSQKTLRNYIADRDKHPELAPSKWVKFGKVPVYLYTSEDIDRISKVLAERNAALPLSSYSGHAPSSGRPRKWTPEQAKLRNRLYAQAYYWKNRVAHLESAGAPAAELRDAKRKLKAIKAQLKDPA